MAALTCVVYNHLLTLDAEVKYTWKRPFSLLKLLFLYDRYVVEGSLGFILYSESCSEIPVPRRDLDRGSAS